MRFPDRVGRRLLRGARVQRPLWASTGTKNPAYSDVLYVDELIGPDTVNTVPEATLDAFLDHGSSERMIDRNLAETSTVLDRLSEANIDLDDVAERLEREGLRRLQQVLMRSLQRLLRKPIRPDARACAA